MSLHRPSFRTSGAVVLAVGLSLVASTTADAPAGATAAGGWRPSPVPTFPTRPARARAAASTPPTPPTFTQIAGTDRFETAAKLAETAYTTADTVVLANGLSPADALAGSYLAGQLKAPVLLTQVATTPQATLSAISTLQAKTVYLLGGTGAISTAQEQSLGSTATTNPAGGNLTVTRLAGATRYETAEKVAMQPGAAAVGSVGGQPTALIANGVKFPDALAGGAIAAGAAIPMLLTDGTNLTTDESQTLQALGIKQVYILGGTGAVSAGIETSLTQQGFSTHRLAGATRTATAGEIATFEGMTLGWTGANNCITDSSGASACWFTTLDEARGDDAGGGADALALGALAGKTKTPILLTASADDPSADLFGEVAISYVEGILTSVTIAGGASAVTAANLQFQQAVTGNTARSDFTATPTSVAPGGDITIDDSGHPCPGVPAGTHAFGVAALIPGQGNAGTTEFDFTESLPLTGGSLNGTITVPSDATAGSYLLGLFCAADFGPGDITQYPYAVYTPLTITVT